MNEHQTLNKVMNEIKINHPRRLGFSLVGLSRESNPTCLSDWRDLVNDELERHGWSFEKLSKNLSLSSNIPIDTCKNYLEGLFIDKTYDAFERERTIFNEIEKHYSVRWATVQEEFTYAIDMVVENSIGVQVKPQSYDNAVIDVHKRTVSSNELKNMKWGKAIVYVYYRGSTIFMEHLIQDLNEITKPTKEPMPKKVKRNLDDWM